MKIDLEVLKNTRGIGAKTLQNIIESQLEKKTLALREDIDNVQLENHEQVPLNTFITGDNLTTLLRFPSESIDLTVTSPPYGAMRGSYEELTINFNNLVQQLWRVTKEGGVVVWNVDNSTVNGSEQGEAFQQALSFINNGWLLHDTMIFAKNTSTFPASPRGNRYTQIFEYMFVFSKGTPKTANLICDKANKYAGTQSWGKKRFRDPKNQDKFQIHDEKVTVPEFSPRTNIWKYNVNGGFMTKDKIAHEHPAIFPEQMARDHILSWSNEGDVVLDIYSGSGTTAKMAKMYNRNYIGIDLEEKFNQIARQRLKTMNDLPTEPKGYDVNEL